MVMQEDGTMVEREMSFNTRDALQARMAKTAKAEDLTTDIIAMLSPEGERINLGKVYNSRLTNVKCHHNLLPPKLNSLFEIDNYRLLYRLNPIH